MTTRKPRNTRAPKSTTPPTSDISTTATAMISVDASTATPTSVVDEARALLETQESEEFELDRPTETVDEASQKVATSIEDPKVMLKMCSVQDGESDVLSGPAEQTRIPIGRPGNQHAFCISPDPDHRYEMMCFRLDPEDSSERTLYGIAPEVAGLVPESCALYRFHLCVSPSATYRLLPICMKLSRSGTLNSWHESLLHVVNNYAGKWIRCSSDQSIGGYLVQSMKVPAEPRFPDLPMEDIVLRAFTGRLIVSSAHPIIADQLGQGGA